LFSENSIYFPGAIPMPASNTYNLKPVNLPRIAGLPLKIFVELLEFPLTRSLLLPNLLRSGGIEGFHRRVFTEPPTYRPFWRDGSPAAAPALQPADLPLGQPALKGFSYASIADYHAAYRSGKVSPLEIARWVVESTAASNAHEPPLRAIILSDPVDVLAQAERSAARWRAGAPLSPLDGVPVAVKDEFDQAGYPTRVGTQVLGSSPAQTDAEIVARARAAGALLFGKANMHEIGIGVTGHNTHHGVPRNPHHPGHYTGGSSSGPAAAVAAGLCPAALGADGGGSIRIPSGFCGLVGLKPTYGRVSERGSAPLCWSVAHNGPLAARAADAAILYGMIAGTDPLDANTLHQPPVSLAEFNNLDLRGLRIGVYADWFNHANPEVVARCEALLKEFTRMGAELVDVVIPDLEAVRVGHVITILSEMFASLEKDFSRQKRSFGLDVRTNFALGQMFTATDYVQAQRARTRAIQGFSAALERVDVIATPTTAITAPPILADSLPDGDSDLYTLTEIMRFAVAANFTGLPAVSFPAGYDTKGLPVGLQMIGRAWSEALLLRLANAAGQVVERRKPQLLYQPPIA
jgi:Asp-tRNA(Asn)/Glu-tRNA(Gln) amidotransferase A subunit family amidase